MLTPSNTGHQTSFFGTDLLLQLDSSDPLIQLSQAIPWSEFEDTFAKHYSKDIGASKVLLKEHGFMRMLIPRLRLETAKEDLAEFALVLKNHTRMEERELFPIVESLFTEEQLEAVLNFVPIN